jgi:hypothetical protein
MIPAKKSIASLADYTLDMYYEPQRREPPTQRGIMFSSVWNALCFDHANSVKKYSFLLKNWLMAGELCWSSILHLRVSDIRLADWAESKVALSEGDNEEKAREIDPSSIDLEVKLNGNISFLISLRKCSPGKCLQSELCCLNVVVTLRCVPISATWSLLGDPVFWLPGIRALAH